MGDDSTPARPRVRKERSVHPGPKSCQQCRKSKQRCDLPDRHSLQPSLQPQPAHLECHRCKVLKLPCVVEVALQPANTPPHGDSPAKPVPAAGSAPALPRKRSGSPLATASRRPSMLDNSTPSSASPLVFPQSHTRYPGEGPESQSGVHLFDPHFEGKEYHLLPTPHRLATAAAGGRDANVAQSHPSTTAAEQEINAAMGLLRPFPYLSRLCCIQPGFFAPPRAAAYECDLPLQEIVNRHVDAIHWEAMNIHVQSFQLFLPFLERLQRNGRSIESGGIWFVMTLYLASTRTDLIDLQADLLAYLRRHVLSCLIRGPATIGETAALVAVALYEPLLLAKSVDDMQLDGAGILSSASAAAKSLGLDAVPSAMHTFDFRSGRSPTGLLRQCALYVTIALCSEQQSMMGNTRHRVALLHASDSQLLDIDVFCRRVLESSAFQHDAEQASLLLILLFRYRAARGFRLMDIDHCSMLRAQPDPLSEAGEQTLRRCIAETHHMANDLLEQLPSLRHGMALAQDTFNMYLDFLESEIEQLRMFNLSKVQDTCVLLLTAMLEGRLSLPEVVQSILPNERALRFISIIGIPKTAACRKMAVLLSNFFDRWSDGEHRRNRSRAEEVSESSSYARNYPLAPPPAYFCAAILPNIKTLCEGAAGSFHLGSAAGNQLVEGDADLAASLTRQFSQTLLRLTRTPQSQTLFHAKGHCDLLQMVARIARQTSLAIQDFTASCKGLRTNVSTPPKAGLPFIVRHDGDALSTVKPANSKNNFSNPAAASSSSSMTAMNHHQEAKHEHGLTGAQRRASAVSSTENAAPSLSVSAALASGPDALNFDLLLQDILSTPIIMSG